MVPGASEEKDCAMGAMPALLAAAATAAAAATSTLFRLGTIDAAATFFALAAAAEAEFAPPPRLPLPLGFVFV